MKKIIFSILIAIFAINASADTVTENKIDEVKALIQKQDIVADAIDTYISLYGILPTTLSTLQNAKLIGTSFAYSGTISVDGATSTITLTDTIDNPEAYQVDYYNNTNDKDKYSTHSVSGSSFIAKYPFTSKAIFSYIAKSSYSSLVVSPTVPASPTDGTLWLNTLTKQYYIYSSGTWSSLNPRKLWIVRDAAELPSSATLSDGAIVLKTDSLTKYLYTTTGWQIIPQSIPFTYNGAF